MNTKRNPWTISLVVFIIWFIIVIGGKLLQVDGDLSQEALISGGILWPLVLVLLFLILVVAYFKWWRRVGIKGPDRWRDLRLMWLPVLALILIWMLVESSGFPPRQALWFIVINTLLVGISEELMFRGILFFGASSKYGWQRAVWITAVIFGLVHSLNGMITGNFTAALLQAMMAFLFGVWTAAVRFRLNTIILLMFLHWLWDFGVFSLSVQAGVKTILGAGLPILFAIILFLYGVWLLDGSRQSEVETLPASELGDFL